MKTTGEPIEDYRTLRRGDVYVCQIMLERYIGVFRHISDGQIVDSEAFSMANNRKLSESALTYDPAVYKFRWPNEEELTKFGFKQRKVMFHEC